MTEAQLAATAAAIAERIRARQIATQEQLTAQQVEAAAGLRSAGRVLLEIPADDHEPDAGPGSSS